MERGNFFEAVTTASYFIMVGFFVLLVATIFLGMAQAALTQILQELRRIQTPAPAPAPQPAPPAGPTELEIQAMVEARAQELLRQREAARRAMVPPPVKSDTLTPTTPKNPATAAPKPNPAKPITPPKPTT